MTQPNIPLGITVGSIPAHALDYLNRHRRELAACDAIDFEVPTAGHGCITGTNRSLRIAREVFVVAMVEAMDGWHTIAAKAFATAIALIDEYTPAEHNRRTP